MVSSDKSQLQRFKSLPGYVLVHEGLRDLVRGDQVARVAEHAQSS